MVSTVGWSTEVENFTQQLECAGKAMLGPGWVDDFPHGEQQLTESDQRSWILSPYRSFARQRC